MNTVLKISLLSAVLAGSAAADVVEKNLSHLKLRAQAHVRGDVVTVSDVLVFTRADPRLLSEIGEEPIAADLIPGAETQISHDQIVERLAELGVNLARVLVSGSLSCHVTLEPIAVETSADDIAEEPPLLREGAEDGGAATLANVLRSHIENELAPVCRVASHGRRADDSTDTGDGTVEIEFERAGEEFLELTTPPFDFAIHGGRGQRLGLREFSVTLRRDGRVQRTVRIGARVKLVKQVLVAAKPLSIGGYIKHDSLEYATRVFSSDQDLGIDHPEQVIGQRVKNFVPAGQMIRDCDLKSVDLVRRSQPVTVVGGDSVSIRVTGDALESGGYGETVRVRLGDSRKNRREIRGVVVGVGTVRLADGGL
jgi:flagella basal body P-ring formation protein FlgA